MSRILVPLLLLLISAGDLSAQEPAPLRSGDRLRVQLEADPRLWTGNLVALQPTSLVLASLVGSSDTVPYSAIARLERSAGSHSFATPPLIGAGIGALLGLAFANGNDNGDCPPELCQIAEEGGGWVYLVAAGATVGTVVSILRAGERWKVVSHP